MGNLLAKLPAFAQDNVLEHLSVKDAENLMAVDAAARYCVTTNRGFWARKAMWYYDKDPALFKRLGSHHLFDGPTLKKHVCKANLTLGEIEETRESGHSYDEYFSMKERILHLAVDEMASRIAVHFRDQTTEIHSLIRMGAPPLCRFSSPPITSMILHGNFLFKREPERPASFHVDAVDWMRCRSAPSLEPSDGAAGAFPLKSSDQFLLAYDGSQHEALLFTLRDDSYDEDPFYLEYPKDSRLEDQATRGSSLYVILQRFDRYVFFEYVVTTGQKIREFLVATPATFLKPSIAYPFILITQSPCPPARLANSRIDLRIRRPFYIYSARIVIPGGDTSVRSDGQVVADTPVRCVSSRAQYLFIPDEDRMKVVPLDNPEAAFYDVDSIGHAYKQNLAASYGLSYVFAQGPGTIGPGITIRRFFRDREFALL